MEKTFEKTCLNGIKCKIVYKVDPHMPIIDKNLVEFEFVGENKILIKMPVKMGANEYVFEMEGTIKMSTTELSWCSLDPFTMHNIKEFKEYNAVKFSISCRDYTFVLLNIRILNQGSACKIYLIAGSKEILINCGKTWCGDIWVPSADEYMFILDSVDKINKLKKPRNINIKIASLVGM